MTLTCPIDGTRLNGLDTGVVRCTNGHSFDRARDGYLNLLVVQHKASRDPGDSKAMVSARRRFLDAGHYAPIAERNCRIVATLAAARAPDAHLGILDAGCGEGYYLNEIKSALALSVGRRLQLAGIDISKWAIQAAAKRYPGCVWAVASNRHLPFAPGSMDLILSMFGFPLWDSFAAQQPVAGYVLLVDPGPEHLIELRSVIYPTVIPTEPPSLEPAQRAGYTLTDEQRLTFPVELESAPAISDLLSMTPHDHRAPLAGRQALAALTRLSVTADVVFRLLHRRAIQFPNPHTSARLPSAG